MAQGPDPNREFDTDRELTAEDERGGGGIGNPGTTRLGMSSGVTAVVVILVVVILFVVF